METGWGTKLRLLDEQKLIDLIKTQLSSQGLGTTVEF